jgi:hypothetical protein
MSILHSSHQNDLLDPTVELENLLQLETSEDESDRQLTLLANVLLIILHKVLPMTKVKCSAPK